MLDLLLALGDLNRPRGLACLSTCLMPCPWLGPGVGEGVRGAGWGRGEPRSPPPHMTTHTLLHTSSLPLPSFLLISPPSCIPPFLSLSPHFIISYLKLYLSLDLCFCSPFLSPSLSSLSPSLPPSWCLFSLLWCLSLQCSPAPPTHKPTHILYLLHCIFTTFSRFRYV